MSRAVDLWVGKSDDAAIPPRVRLRVFEARLLAKRRINETTGCWEFTGARKAGGYGHMKFEDGYQGAHRVSYRIYKGDIPHGMFVCHHCDNPPCFNPDHLWLGTVQDNADDMIRKGAPA